MDPSTWLAIGIMGVAALVADVIIAYEIAGRYGPDRARKLILNDPEYVATRTSLNAIYAMLEKMELPDLRDVEKALARLEVAAERAREVSVSLPEGALQSATRSLKSTMKRQVEEALEEALSRLQGPQAPTAEQAAAAIVEQQEAMQWAQYLLDAGVPEPMVAQAAEVVPQLGSAVMKRLADFVGVELPE